MVEILLFSVGSGAAVTWMLFAFIRRKERNLKLLAVAFLVFASCSGSKHAGQYLVSVRGENDTLTYVDTRAQVDSIVIRALDGELMGKRKPFFEIKNSEVFIYVEKKK